MKWMKRAAPAVVALLALLLVLSFVVPVDDYRPRIERELSARLKEPVSITRLRAHVLPLPHATAKGIRVGKTDDVNLAALVITPDMSLLLAATKVIRSVELSGRRLTQAGLQKLAALGADGSPPKGAPALVRVTRVKVMDGSNELGNYGIGIAGCIC